MSVAINLVPGRYYAGFTRPWYASQSAVTSRLEDAGLTHVTWHPRESSQPPVNPHSDPGYKDSWDEWISVDMPTSKVVELPARPAWIVAAPRPRPTPPAGSTAPAPAPGKSDDPPPLTIVEKPDSQNGVALFVGLSIIAIGVARGRRKDR
jgi:hypothetical protein